MKRRQYILILVMVLAPLLVSAQQSIAFQQLRNATFQSTNYNPAWMPKGTLFVGLPVMSGFGFYVNNRFSYNELLTDNENGGKLLNIDNVIENLGVNNLLSAHVNVSLFHLGARTPTGHSFALFANERFESDATYPKSLLDWAWNGNAEFIGRDVSLSKMGLTTNYFREYGLAYAVDSPDHGVKLGVRAKYYQGLVNASTPAGLAVDILTENENLQINLDNKDLTLRTAGVETIIDGNNLINYLISNGNRGFGIDLGIEKKLNKYYTVGLGITDIGFISWKEGIQNVSVADTSMRYIGVQLKGIHDLVETVQDSLLDRFSLDSNTNAYTTLAVTRFNGHFIYSPMPYLDIITSASGKLIQGQPKMGYGVGLRGYLGPKLIASANINRLPQQFLNIGAALTISPGPVQLYVAVDKVLGYSVPNMQWAEAKLGLNFIFGNKSRFREAKLRSNQIEEDRIITESKGVLSGTFMGNKVNVKRQEGIYTIIDKQPRSQSRTITPVVVNGDHKEKTVQSATGQGRSFYEKKQVRSATGQVYKNDYKQKNVGSATATQSRNSYKKTKRKIRSVSGGAQRSGGKRKKNKIRSSSSHRGED
jgi:hypothetical protein